MVTVKALKSFDHHGKRQLGESFDVSEVVARQLRRARLVSVGCEESKSRPIPAAGTAKQSSASPAAPASQTNKSKSSGKRTLDAPAGSLL